MTDQLAARRRRPLPAGLVLLLGLLAAGFGYSAVAGPTAHADASSLSQQVEQGRRLFAVGCSSCHGLNAQGSSQAPSLIGVGGAAVDFQVGSGRMPLAQQGAQADRKAVRYQQGDIDAMAAYIASLGGGPAQPSAELLSGVKDADLAAGGELFRTNCASCHNFAGRGGALPHGQYAPVLAPASAKQIYEAMLTGPENMPVFSDQQLAPAEKLKLIHYLQTLERQRDPGGFGLARIGPVPEFIVALVVGIVGCVIAALWIGSRV